VTAILPQTPDELRKKGVAARATARGLGDPGAQKSWLDVADQWDALAAYAEAQQTRAAKAR
jgi:hypothetical protein